MNLRISEKYGNLESHIKNNFLKYIFMLSIFMIGVLIGGICLNFLKNNNENIFPIKELIEEIIDNIINERWMTINQYFFKDLKKIILITIISTSMIGLPLLLVWIFYDGLTLSFTIGSLIYTYNMLKGNLVSFVLLFFPNIFSLLAITIITISSIKLINNFFKTKKSLKVETLRHLMVCAVGALMIGSGFLIRIFLMNFIENILKIY